MELGSVGVWTSLRRIGEEGAGEAAQLVQELGFGTFWLGGSPRLPAVRPLLAATDRLAVATGIVNVWQYEPGSLAAEHAQLAIEFPDRLLLGLGIGHPEATAEYARPLTTMRTFLDGLDAADTPVPRDQRCLAALGPRMLDLCAQRTRGALPYFVPVDHTRFARAQMGPDPLLATELACVLDADADRARATAREYATLYLGLRNYAGNLKRFGFTDEDCANGGSDRLIDAVIPHGSVDQIAGVVHEHLAAGANHVCLQPIGVDGIPRQEWAALASALIS
jgi:probable F420-dependent oxidoreductase